MRRLMIAAGMLLAVPVVPAVAANDDQPSTGAPATRGASASRAELMALAEAMAPREVMVRNELDGFNRQFPIELRKQEGFAELETAFPALVAELVVEMKAPFERYMHRLLDGYFGEVATILGSELDAAGVATLTRFYRSPAGQRIVLAMLENFDDGEIVEAYSSGGEVDAAMLDRGLDRAADKATDALSPEDQTELILLMKEPSFWTLRKLNPRILATKSRLMNADDPQFEKDTEAAFERVMERLALAGEAAEQ